MFTGIEPSTEYNSILYFGKTEGLQSIIRNIYVTYANVILYFVKPVSKFGLLLAIFNCLLALLSLVIMVVLVKRRKIRGKSLGLLIVLICLMPFGMNISCFLSHGIVHELMMYSFVFVYIFVGLLTREFMGLNYEKKIDQWLRRVIIVVYIMIIYSNSIYSNQTYEKKALEYQSTLLTMNRVVSRMEQTEGYVLGETPVAIIGLLTESSLKMERAGFNYDGIGLTDSFSVTYYGTYDSYFKNILAYPVMLLSETEAQAWSEREEVKMMPCFPNQDACQMIDGVLVVKLSEMEN